MPWWGIIHIERYERVIWGAKFYFDFNRKSFKNPSYLAGRIWLTWFFMLALKNCDKEAWTKTSAMKGQHKKSRGLKFLKWSSKLRHWITEFRSMKSSYSETGGPVLTPDFGKFEWELRSNRLFVSVGKPIVSNSCRWSRKYGSWRFTHESNSNKRLMGTCMRVCEVTWEREESKRD